MASAARRPRLTRRPTTWADELATLLPVLLVLVGGLWFATRHEAQGDDLARASLLVLLAQTLPGAVIWRSVRPVSGWLVEDVAMGTAIGAALAVPGQVLGTHLDEPGLRWALGPALAFLTWFLPRSRGRVRRAQWYRLPLTWGWLAAVAAAVTVVVGARGFGEVLPGHAPSTSPPPEALHHVALTAELEHRLPPLDDGWFAHAWLGNLAALTGAPNDVLLTRWAPVFLGVAVVLALACLGTRLVGPVTGVGLGVGGLAVAVAAPATPSTGFAVLVASALLALLRGRWRGETPRWALPLLVFLVVVLAGAVAGGLGARPVDDPIRAGHWQAMRWIADHAGPDDVVMTNGQRVVLEAYGERRLLDGGTAARRQADHLYVSPSQSVAAALYDRGVRWVYAERTAGFSAQLGDVADEVYANEDAVVYRLRGGEGE